MILEGVGAGMKRRTQWIVQLGPNQYARSWRCKGRRRSVFSFVVPYYTMAQRYTSRVAAIRRLDRCRKLNPEFANGKIVELVHFS